MAIFFNRAGIVHWRGKGIFDKASKEASQLFQSSHGLEPDGKVGDKSDGAAMMLGFSMITDTDEDKGSVNWPPKPGFNPW